MIFLHEFISFNLILPLGCRRIILLFFFLEFIHWCIQINCTNWNNHTRFLGSTDVGDKSVVVRLCIYFCKSSLFFLALVISLVVVPSFLYKRKCKKSVMCWTACQLFVIYDCKLLFLNTVNTKWKLLFFVYVICDYFKYT